MLARAIPSSSFAFAQISRNMSSLQKTYNWNGQNINYEIVNPDIDNLPIVFMPAPFPTTHRDWFKPIIERMETQNPIVLLEPPGFGENSSVVLKSKDMKPDTYINFIEGFLKHTQKVEFSGRKLGLFASGHAGCFSLEVAKNNADLFDRIMLTNATYQSPFSSIKAKMTAKGKGKFVPIANTFFNLFYYIYVTPGLGRVANHMMSTPKQIRNQVNTHVFSDKENVTPELIDKMVDLFRMPRSKWLQPSFMCGLLDPYTRREQMIAALGEVDKLGVPVNSVLCKQMFLPTENALDDVKEFEGNSKNYKTTLMEGALWSYVEYPDEFSKIFNKYFS